MTRITASLCSVDVGLCFRHATDRAILAGVYRMFSVGSDFHEICDECGFHGGTIDLSAAVARIRALPDRWSEVMSQDEERLRARPEPDTWLVRRRGRTDADADHAEQLQPRVDGVRLVNP